MGWIHLVQDRGKRWDVANTVMNTLNKFGRWGFLDYLRNCELRKKDVRHGLFNRQLACLSLSSGPLLFLG